MTSSLLIAQLAFYAPLTLPTLYLLYSHGRHGFLAWLYLLAFCVLRVTGAAMGLNDPHNAGTQIISSIGLSPLLLAIDGMLHEARIYCLSPSKRTEWAFMALIHVLSRRGLQWLGSVLAGC
ncbi:integral membrane protein [Aspergillus bombycis]|uniref:Integral membrane protein n=1 Tax=Aspergillus bombycis TaxID=109264 RepID=A0A1F8A8A4_9EURO|nr:integral membrane protein [Aspergillus bombycis]OGM47962.1 integral membrane protein [Aspergillus bombycis]